MPIIHASQTFRNVTRKPVIIGALLPLFTSALVVCPGAPASAGASTQRLKGHKEMTENGRELRRKVAISQVATALGLELRSNNARCIHPERHKHGDANPSLSVVDTPDGGYFKCFACDAKGDALTLIQEVHRCGFKEALAWLAELAGEPLDTDNGKRQSGKLVKPWTLMDFAKYTGLPEDWLRKQGVYDKPLGVFLEHQDEGGNVIATKRRSGASGRSFRWPKGKKTCLYGLPWLKDYDTTQPLVLVEGETDSLVLRYHGIQVLGVPGANGWKDEYCPHAERFDQVLLQQEPDRGGDTFIAKVTGSLRANGYGGRVKGFSWPDGTKDARDALKVYGDAFKEKFDQALAGAKEVELESRTPEPAARLEVLADFDIHLTDMGNARRFVAQHGDVARYVAEERRWYVWDGKRWAHDKTGRAERLAKNTADKLWDQVKGLPEGKAKDALVSHALRSESVHKLAAMLALAQTESGIAITADQLDRDPWLLNVENGTLNLRTGELQPHGRDDLITKLAGAEYDPSAEAPTWWAFLRRIFKGNEQLIRFVQRAMGYSLTGITSERKFFILHGTGANGKTTLTGTMSAAFGDYSWNTPVETLMARRNQGASNDLARLKGSRFVTSSESDEGARLAENLVKQLTGGGDKVTARFLYAEYVQYVPTFKLWLSTNHRPRIRGTDCAIWDRIKLIPFLEVIPEAERIPDLGEHLINNELAGILTWAVEGCLEWSGRGLGVPPEVMEATEEYRQAEDVLGAFLGECCEFSQDATVRASDLYESYRTWAERNGERPVSNKLFSKHLLERGVDRARERGGRVYLGLTLSESV